MIVKAFDKFEDNLRKEGLIIAPKCKINNENKQRLYEYMTECCYTAMKSVLFNLRIKGLRFDKDFLSDVEVQDFKILDRIFYYYKLKVLVYQSDKTFSKSFVIVL